MRVTSVFADLHVFDGVVNWAQPSCVALTFSDGFYIRLCGASDGETMVFDRLPLDGPYDMQECGRVEVHDVTDRIDPSLRGCECAKPVTIHDGSGHVIGLAIPRPSAAPICFWNYGDELYWGDWEVLISHDWEDWVSPSLGETLP